MTRPAVELIDAKIKKHVEEAETHETAMKNHEKNAENRRAAAKLHRDLIAELEHDKAVLLGWKEPAE